MTKAHHHNDEAHNHHHKAHSVEARHCFQLAKSACDNGSLPGVLCTPNYFAQICDTAVRPAHNCFTLHRPWAGNSTATMCDTHDFVSFVKSVPPTN